MPLRLSVNCMTRGPGLRVAAQLALLRAVADEIVVAVDDRADPEVAQELSGVADRLLVYPFADPVDRPLAWLHGECRGDWILTVDDDEVVGSELIERLPDLLRDETSPTTGCAGSGSTRHRGIYLDLPPWNTDYLLRLVRNDLRLLRFPNEPHYPIEARGPCRYLDLPTYHLDTVVNSLERRQAKVARYEEFQPTPKRAAGLPINVAFYLPELRPDVATLAVPPADVRLIQRVLDGAPIPPRPVQAERVTREQVDRAWEGRPLRDEDYAARIDVVGCAVLVAGEAQTIDVRVTNLGNATWPWGHSHPEIRLVARWPNAVGAAELRTPFPADLGPADTQLVPVHVAAPAEPGFHLLEIDLVHEHTRWFGCGARIEVEVLPVPELQLGRDPRAAASRGTGRVREQLLVRLGGYLRA